MSEERVFSIPRWLVVPLQLSLKLIETRFIARIPIPEIQAGLMTLIKPLSEMVLALSDGNPRNADQLREIWAKWTNQDLYRFSVDTTQLQIAKIQKEWLRELFTTLSIPTLQMVQIFSDDDKDNERQLEDNWKAYIKSPETHRVMLGSVLTPLLEQWIKDEFLLFTILTTIQSQIAAGESDIPAEFAELVYIKPELQSMAAELKAA